MKTMIFDNIDDMKLKSVWNELYNNPKYNRNPFMSYSHMSSWITINNRIKLYKFQCYVYYEDEEIVGIIPIAIRKVCYIVKLIYFAGAEFHDYNDILVRNGFEETVVNAFIKHLKINEIAILRGIRIDSTIFKALNIIRSESLSFSTISPYCSILDDNTIRKSTLSDIKYNVRRLSKEGDIEFLELDNQINKKNELEKLINMHINEWNFKKQKSLFEKKYVRDYYIDTLHLEGDVSDVLLCEVNHRNKPIAMAYCHTRGDSLFYYKPTYSIEYSKYSPGKILIWYIREYWKKKDGKIIDFLVGDEPYKFDWSEKYDEIYSSFLSNNPLLNKLIVILMKKHDNKTT